MCDAEVVHAVGELVNVWDSYTLDDLGPKLTCSEFEALAEVFKAAGHDDMAAVLLDSHAAEDDEGDEHHVA